MKKDDLLKQWKSNKTITDESVLKAFEEVPREIFMLPEYKEMAYDDTAMPLISNQTISQPTTVMIMTQALELKPGMKVLEVGTGSGYQAAIIAKIVGKKGKVFTTEIIKELAGLASSNLKKAGISNAEIIKCDGSSGYEKEAPYDRIIITAASPKIPKQLLPQLKENGIVVVPVGDMYEQEMIKIRKGKEGFKAESLGLFRFVPLTGEYGNG